MGREPGTRRPASGSPDRRQSCTAGDRQLLGVGGSGGSVGVGVLGYVRCAVGRAWKIANIIS